MQGEHQRIPWVTASVVALAIAAWGAPDGVQRALLYERSAVLRGELWRLWSGHLVHFSASHLGWNLLVVGLSGAWIECSGFRARGWFAAAAPPAIGLALLVGEPSLGSYGGLSGVATAAVAFACASEWRRGTGPRSLWCMALALIGLKSAWEYWGGGPLFAHYALAAVRTVPLSHLSGACIGAALGFLAGPGRTRPLSAGAEGMTSSPDN
jgi:rhomboid family GlyGly-CTERM serine protease